MGRKKKRKRVEPIPVSVEIPKVVVQPRPLDRYFSVLQFRGSILVGEDEEIRSLANEVVERFHP